MPREPYHRRAQERPHGRIIRLDGELRGVDEQSHKDEMRSALRGDFERLRARRSTPDPTVEGAPTDGTVDPTLALGASPRDDLRPRLRSRTAARRRC